MIVFLKLKNRVFLFFLIIATFNSFCQDKNLLETISISENSTLQFPAIKTSKFTPIITNKLGYKNDTYWFKITLKKEALHQQEIVFNFEEPSIKMVNIYNSSKELFQKKSIKGATNINIEIPNISSLTYYIKIDFTRQVHVPITVTNFKVYQQQQNNNRLIMGFYYGIVFMVLIINLIFFVSLKDITFLYYSLFLAAINLAFAGFDGILFLFFDPENLDKFTILCHFLIQLFGALFASYFLNLKNFSLKNNIGFYALLIPLGFYLVYFLTDRFLFVAIADILGMAILTFYWLLGVLLIKKEKFALFFVIGYSMILFAGYLFLIPINFGWFEGVNLNQLKIGAVFEMLVLTYSITYRAKILQEENRTIQEELKAYIIQITALKKKIKPKEQQSKQEITTEEKLQQIASEHYLTERETDILLQITNGLSNQQIANELFISINTVKYHTRNIYEKLNVKKRTEIASKILTLKN